MWRRKRRRPPVYRRFTELFVGCSNCEDRALYPIKAIVLVIAPAPKAGRFLGYVGDELIVTSCQPFLDGARALLACGYDPATPYNMRRADSDVPSLSRGSRLIRLGDFPSSSKITM
jgi:hypothetical protein